MVYLVVEVLLSTTNKVGYSQFSTTGRLLPSTLYYLAGAVQRQACGEARTGEGKVTKGEGCREVPTVGSVPAKVKEESTRIW